MAGLRCSMDDERDISAVFLEKREHCRLISNINVVMRKTLEISLQPFGVPGRGCLGTEKILSHVVVEANDLQPFFVNKPRRFAPYESR